MQRDDPERINDSLRDMLDAIRLINQYTAGLPKDRVEQVNELRDATILRLIIIGEAANRISRDFQAKYPEIPWAEVVGFRNVVLHGYDRVQWDIVWDTVKNDLPVIATNLRNLLGLPEPPPQKGWEYPIREDPSSS